VVALVGVAARRIGEMLPCAEGGFSLRTDAQISASRSRFKTVLRYGEVCVMNGVKLAAGSMAPVFGIVNLHLDSLEIVRSDPDTAAFSGSSRFSAVRPGARDCRGRNE
jgi:hypothetical protein